jgi:protein-S-isoprenylcysteine O-methyltransferase Ste14
MKTQASILNRSLIFIYGVLSYVMFLVVFIYSAGFIGNVGVPKSIDSAPTLPLWQALLVNLGVLTVFSLQHSVMARPAFKHWWTRYVPEPAERSTYVLFSNVAMILIFALWQPMGGVVWHLTDPAARAATYAAFALGWLLVLVASFGINHFDLFGLRQVWLHLRGRKNVPLSFGTPGLYRYVRHPLYVGWLLSFWATPTMTVAHLVFALATTVYILIAIRYEERDLIAEHGEDYLHYRKTVPKFVPRISRSA